MGVSPTGAHPIIDYFILADRSEAVNGKIYIMGGGWDRIAHADFNAAVLISFAAGILVPPEATNEQYSVRFSIETIEGKQLQAPFSITAFFTASPPPTPGDTQRVVLAVPMLPVLFPGPGVYAIWMRIDNGEARANRFRLVDAMATTI